MSPSPPARLFYLILDGLGDEPSSELGNRTPLACARTPHLDKLAREGEAYLLDLRDQEGTAATHIGQFALLGLDPWHGIPRRGPVEAAGAGLSLEDGDVALRGNFATITEEQEILDRRAGRIRRGTLELAKSLDHLNLGDGITLRVRSATEHRLAILLRGPGLSPAISGNDPMSLQGSKTFPLPVGPLDESRAAAFTASKLRKAIACAGEILRDHPVNVERRQAGLVPASGILVRQPGQHIELPTFREKYGLRSLCIAADRTVLGVSRLVGISTFTRSEFTANVDTDLGKKFETALHYLGRGDLDVVLLHVKATDILGHDRKPAAKAAYLETIDAHLGAMLRRLSLGAAVAVASDHSTSSTTGNHIKNPVPALAWATGLRASGVKSFSEEELCRHGCPVLRGSSFFRRLAGCVWGR